MSVEMWNCLFWPLSASYIHICIVVDLAIKLIYCSNDGGYICLWVSMTTLNSEEITLSSDRAEWGYICLWVSMTTLNSEEITLSSATVDWGEVYLPLSVNDNIEQWRDHSVLCYCYPGGYICLWVSMTTLNSKEITLSSAKLTKGGYLPLSVNDNIEQWRDHSVLCYCWLGGVGISASWVSMTTLNSEEITLSSAKCDQGGYICLWVSMTTLNSKEITLSSAKVDQGGISACECQWQHWTVKRSLCPLIDWGEVYLLTMTTLGRISVLCWVSMTTLNSKEITLSSDSVDRVVYLPLSINDNIEQ